MDVQNVVSAHARFSSVVTNDPLLLVHEIVYGYEVSENGQRQMLLPEQYSKWFMKDVVHKFAKSFQQVLNPFWKPFYSEGMPNAGQ